MINHGAATGRTGLKTGGANPASRIIANKNSPLNPYIIDFFLPIDLPSMELRRKGWQKRHDILKKEEA